MKLSLTDIPNRITEAKQYLDFREKSTPINNQVFVNVDKLKIYEVQFTALMKQCELEFNQLCYEASGHWVEFDLSNKNNIKNAFTKMLGIPINEITYKGKFSLRSEVITRLYRKYRMPALFMYIQYTKYKSKLSGVRQYLPYIDKPSTMVNNVGEKIVSINTNYNFSDTFRNQTYNPNFQGTNKELSNIITAPKGWVIIQADSEQIEPRLYYSTVVRDKLINWLIEEYNDVYLALVDYCMRDDIEFHEGNLKREGSFNRKHRNTLKTLVNAGTYGSSLKKLKDYSSMIYEDSFFQTEEGREISYELSKSNYYKKILDNPQTPPERVAHITESMNKTKEKLNEVREEGNILAERFHERIVNHPQRLKFEDEVNQKIYSGNNEIISPFGDSRIVYGDFNYKRNCHINNPMQMAAARLSAISICKAFEFINSHDAYKKGVIFGVNVHDEDVFFVRKELVPFVKDTIKDFRQYHIDSWIPINSSCKIRLDYDKS